MKADILVVDDEADIRSLVQGILEDEGYETRSAADAESAYAEINRRPPSLIVLDIWLHGSGEDGLQILAKVRERYPYLPVLMISGHGTIETAVSAIKIGAYDFIEKPFKADRLLLMIRRALETAALKRENMVLREKADTAIDLVGASALIRNIKQIVEKVAPTNSRVLLTGEAGTGKEVVARLIHAASQRASSPFISINCALLSPDRLEAELFGYEDKNGGSSGLLEQAHGGTLFLDEIADMPQDTQGKIVRVLQEQRFYKISGRDPVEVDIRVIASTNRNLEEEIRAGRFRQDLYYRLNVVPIEMQPLRERIEDVPGLVSHFVQKICRSMALPAQTFKPSAIAALQASEWPGNVRQLRNVVEWVLIMNSKKTGVSDIGPAELPPGIVKSGDVPAAPGGGRLDLFMDMSLREAREMFERTYLLSQVDRFDGNISQTARFVGMERSALHRKLKNLQIPNENKKLSDTDGDETSSALQKQLQA